MELKKTFIAGKMNKDLDERLIPDGEFIDALNITIDTAGGSNIGSVSNSLGNTLVSDIQTIVENEGITYIGSNPKTIGAVTFEANNLIYWMVVSDTFEAIFEYSEIFSFTSIVLIRTDGLLGFNKNYPITGINYIPETTGEGPFLYWTDGINPPRRINISRAKSYVTDDPRMLEDINVILRPPLYAPKINLSFDPAVSVSNNIQDKFLYFSYRFRYTDNQYSSLAPFSAVAFQANSFSYDYATGDNKGMLNKYNKVDITFDTGNEFVQEIQLLFFDTFSLNVSIIDNYNKVDLNIDDNFRNTIVFSANKIYTPLESSEVTRLFDNVPLTAKAQDIIGNRLLYGNYVQFRNIVNEDEVKIIPSYTLTLSPEAITTNPIKTFRSDRDYEIGIIYTDEYGRMTTALTSKTNTLYIPSTNSDTANSIKLELINEAPFWATNYRFAIKQAQGDYYNIFPYAFVVDDVFRYFLINESDRDKITIGGYVIFKTSNSIATHSNKQFKVLELEYKAVSTLFLREGLYFKIKADPIDVFLSNPPQQTITATGSGRGPRPNFCIGEPETISPVIDRNTNVSFDKAYYSATGDNTLILPSQGGAPDINIANFNLTEVLKDYRLTLKILPDPLDPTSIGTHFDWTIVPDGDTGYTGTSIPIPNTPYVLAIDSYDFLLTFNAGLYNIGDIYSFNIRGDISSFSVPSLTTGKTVIDTSGNSGLVDSGNDMSGIPTGEYGGHAILDYNGPIYPGAIIDINIVKDTPPNGNDPVRNQNNTWTSTDYYKNIEEWFWKSGAYQTFTYKNFSDSVVTSANNIIFRRALNTSPLPQQSGGGFNTNYITEDVDGILCMLIRGVGDNDNCSRNEIQASLSITQTPTVQLTAETVPLRSDVDLFYEMRKTYRIDDNHNHLVGWAYADFTDAGPNFPTIPAAAGQTALGPLNPLVATSTDLMHSFNVGETIWVQNSDTTIPIVGPPSGEYNILYVTEYVVVINWSFVQGATTPGKVFYQSWEQDQDGATHLIVELNNTTSHNSDFNAFAFGNGVESNRIYDNFLRPTMKYSPRATSVIEDYQQQNKFASLCYSGIYKGDTSANRLNSFNLSQANFKNLDQKYGPVQKLYALDTNLMAFQQDKITSVLYGKNLLVDAVGGGQVASVPEVLGNQIVHPSEYGISNNPESFATFSNIMFFSDSRRGAVLQMTGDQVIEISANGMQNYFRDEMKDSPDTQKLGVFDPYNSTYVLSFTDEKQGSCDLSISPTSREIKKDSGNLFMFSISSSSFWTVSLVNDGFGTGWISIDIDSGYGSQDITASVDENLSVDRSVIFRVTYCDGETVDFILTQNGPV
jgi:hypothetical protein